MGRGHASMRCAGWLLSALCAAVAPAFGGTSWTRDAGSIWQDGLLLGDGATAALAYAPMHLEWLVNRNDIFDSRVFACDYTPHDEVMRCVATNAGHSVAFLGPREKPSVKGPPDGERLTLSVSAAILRVRFWLGLGWSMPSVPKTVQTLDTRTGELVERMDSPYMSARTVSFVERSRDVMAVSFEDPSDPGCTAYVDLARPEDPRLDNLPFEWRVEGGVVSFSQRMPGGETYAVAATAPDEVATVGRLAKFAVKGAGSLFLAVRTTRDAADPRAAAVAAVLSAARDGFEKVRADHRAWWKGFWERGARASFASDESVDRLWNFSLYALASQFGKAPMPALNGLAHGPLGSGVPGIGSHTYVHDQNVQIPMMPFFPLGHPEFVETFAKTYEDALPELRRRTKEVFGADGAYLPLNMNPNGREQPVMAYRYTLCGGAYSGLVLSQAWWYTHDESVLRRIYPLLKEFIRFYTSTMTRDERGTYHFIWSVPPEIFTGSVDETAVVACLKPCLETALEAARRFGVDQRESALWADVLAHYPRIARHPDGGWWCGPDVPADHFMYGGHLFYPFFPAESDTDAEAARRTLDYFYRYAIEVSHETAEPHPVHEWSALYSGMATTRLFGGERGWKALKSFEAGFAKPNGLFCHNPIVVTDLTRDEARENVAKTPRLVRRDWNGAMTEFPRRGPGDLSWNPAGKTLVAPVLEGGAAFLLLASEALCQSWGGEVRIFPSVPRGFTGSFENFRVRGGFQVSAAMKDGRVVDFRLDGAAPGRDVKVSCPTDPEFRPTR